jgi:monovalent cation:proton antiporter-2 (CPA2) family protein
MVKRPWQATEFGNVTTNNADNLLSNNISATMHHDQIFVQALVYFAAAIIAVPIFKRLGLGSVLGYLIAGVAIGPWGFKLITDTQSVLQVSELGIVLLLFLVGLELEPKRLWQLRRQIFGLGLMQVAVSIAVIAAMVKLCANIWGAPDITWAIAIVTAMAATMSSTAIALQILEERNLTNTSAGKAAFSVSLFQDLAVIPLLLILAALAPEKASNPTSTFSWKQIGLAIALIAGLVLAGRLLLRPLLRWIAATAMREIFIAFALFLIVGSALLTQSVGLSMALGSFIAGILLADSEYRMELEVDIEPFKGLLLGLFFMAVGMAINVGLVIKNPLLVIALAIGVVALKLIVLTGLAWLFKLGKADTWVFGFSISAVGEFAFVLLGQAASLSILTADQAALCNAVVAISMLTTPLLFIIYQKFMAPRYNKATKPETPDTIVEKNRVIIAGAGRFGQIVLRLLVGRQVGVTIIDHDPAQIELIRSFGWRTYYGDAGRIDVLEQAGIDQAQVFVIAIDDVEAAFTIAKYVTEHYPNVKVVARAKGRTDAFALAKLGVEVIRETLGSALMVGELTLEALGDSRYMAKRQAHLFKEYDAYFFQQQLPHIGDREKIRAMVNQGRDDVRNLLEAERDARKSQPSGETSW